jgi:FdhD protein
VVEGVFVGEVVSSVEVAFAGSPAVVTVPAARWHDGVTSVFEDSVVVEAPLTVLLRQHGRSRVLGSTMRTPGDDGELAVGMAVGEGIARRASDVVSVEQPAAAPDLAHGDEPDGDVVVLTVSDEIDTSAVTLGRISRPTSACGVCGRDRLDDLARSATATVGGAAPRPELLVALPELLAPFQEVFRSTGGLHAAGLAATDGSIMAVREDVGRHNAVDKAIGFALLAGVRPAALVVSGRAGFEIVQKAVAAGIPALVSVSATTSLAVEAARASGLTLACFARGGRMTVYSGAGVGRDLQEGTP